MADDSLQTDVATRIDLIRKDFETAWRRGDAPSIEEFVERANPADRMALRAELLAIDRAYCATGQAGTDSGVSATTTADAGEGVAHQSPPATAAHDQPCAFGRYQVTGVLGKGGFGVVYRGFDPDLRREVAIKVPRRERLATSADSEAYLNEARVVASLNHSGIVPVYDCGRTDDGLCYVVSQLIPGGDLAALIARRRPSRIEAADWVSGIADALHHAHQHGLVHRDIKPGNILIDEHGRPLVSDFGLVLTDDCYGRGSGTSGTPAYMSPEQASGNGHRVDARSDVYSLGVVLYELLTGRRPYRHQEAAELLEEICLGDIRPPRQIDHTLPKELEAICLKAVARLPGDRYATAFDLAEDLRQWQKQGQTTSRLATDPATRPPAFKLAIGCGSLLTISITTGAAFLVWLNARDVTTVAVVSHDTATIQDSVPDNASPRPVPEHPAPEMEPPRAENYPPDFAPGPPSPQPVPEHPAPEMELRARKEQHILGLLEEAEGNSRRGMFDQAKKNLAAADALLGPAARTDLDRRLVVAHIYLAWRERAWQEAGNWLDEIKTEDFDSSAEADQLARYRLLRVVVAARYDGGELGEGADLDAVSRALNELQIADPTWEESSDRSLVASVKDISRRLGSSPAARSRPGAP